MKTFFFIDNNEQSEATHDRGIYGGWYSDNNYFEWTVCCPRLESIKFQFLYLFRTLEHHYGVIDCEIVI